MDEENKDFLDKTSEQTEEQTDKSRLTVPAISQPGVILFPYALTPLVLDNPKVIAQIEKAAAGDRLIAVFPEMPDQW